MKEIVSFFYKALNIIFSEINLRVVESLISINAFVTITFLHTFYHFTRITSCIFIFHFNDAFLRSSIFPLKVVRKKTLMQKPNHRSCTRQFLPYPNIQTYINVEY